jgi:peptidoglycan L-alanyl-D-glutamate endopeptidase CwlK
MKDKLTSERIKLLHPKLRDEAIEIYNEICEVLTGDAKCRFAFTLRTFAEQDALYAQGITTGKVVTKARGGQSYHNYGLAIDIVLINGKSALYDIKTDFDNDKNPDWIEVVNVFKQHGWEWGGDWKFVDYPHFQKTFGYSVRDLFKLYNSGKVDKNNYVLI